MAQRGVALTRDIIGGAIEVHRALGPGLLESTYEACLVVELRERGLRVRQQVPLPVHYKGLEVATGYRVDLIVEDAVILELKAVEQLLPIHEAQLLTYLRLSGKQLGLLLNFNVPLMKDGVRRFILDR